jgi:hypothetical protein
MTIPKCCYTLQTFYLCEYVNKEEYFAQEEQKELEADY